MIGTHGWSSSTAPRRRIQDDTTQKITAFDCASSTRSSVKLYYERRSRRSKLSGQQLGWYRPVILRNVNSQRRYDDLRAWLSREKRGVHRANGRTGAFIGERQSSCCCGCRSSCAAAGGMCCSPIVVRVGTLQPVLDNSLMETTLGIAPILTGANNNHLPRVPVTFRKSDRRGGQRDELWWWL